MEEIITACIMFAISILAFVMSIFSFMEKGFLFNNSYIYASRNEREAMNKKPYYKQSAIVFLMVGVIFLLNALSALFDASWILYVVIALVIIAIIYAIVSSIKIDKNSK